MSAQKIVLNLKHDNSTNAHSLENLVKWIATYDNIKNQILSRAPLTGCSFHLSWSQLSAVCPYACGSDSSVLPFSPEETDCGCHFQTKL